MVDSADSQPLSQVTQTAEQSAMGAGLPIQPPPVNSHSTTSTVTNTPTTKTVPIHPLDGSESTQIAKAPKSLDETTSESEASHSAQDANQNGKSISYTTNSNEKDNDSPSRSYTMSSDGESEISKPNKASLIDLFRFASKWDLIFNAAGLLAAIAAGAAQPLMTIVSTLLSWFMGLGPSKARC